MAKRYEYLLILAIGFTGLVLVTSCQPVSSLKIDGLWKLNGNAEKADLNIKVTPETPGSDSGLISGTAHWTGRGGGTPYTQDITGFWDDRSGKIVFLTENKIVFDDKLRTIVSCNTVYPPKTSVENDLKAALISGDDAAKKKAFDELVPCHGRDVGYIGYLFGDNSPNHVVTPVPKSSSQENPWMMTGVEQAYGGGSTGVGANADRNTFGWCATFQVDMCGPQIATSSAMNVTSMTYGSAMNGTSETNSSETAK